MPSALERVPIDYCAPVVDIGPLLCRLIDQPDAGVPVAVAIVAR